jgi:hypothetical protein
MSLISGGGTNQTDKMFSGENGEIMERMEGQWIMQHEFLYLLCNTTNRLDLIEKNHHVHLHSVRAPIFHWELNDKFGTEN